MARLDVRAPGTSSRLRRVHAVAAAALVVLTLPATPAAADIARLTPSSFEIRAGEKRTRTVEVDGAGCLGSIAPPGIIVAILKRECGGVDEWRTEFSFDVAPGTAPGVYQVIAEVDAATRAPVKPVFALDVRAAAGATTSTSTTTTTTTTTAPTSTSVPDPTTSSVPNATTVPSTAGATTTTPPAGPGTGSAQGSGAGIAVGGASGPSGPGGTAVRSASEVAAAGGPAAGGAAGFPSPLPAGPRFFSLASIAAAEPPAGDRLFLPFAGGALRACLPLQGPCADPAAGLVLVPTDGVDVNWTPPQPGPTGPVRTPPTADMPVLPAVGQEPAGADATTFLLPVLRVTATSAKVVVMARRFEPGRGFVAGPGNATSLLPTAAGATLAPSGGSPRPAFGPPFLVAGDSLRSRTPVLVVSSSGQMPVLFGIQPDPAWGLKQGFLPLVAPGAVADLAERTDGTVGLLLPQPADVVRPAADPSLALTGGGGGDEPGPDRDNGTVVMTLLGLALLGLVGTAVRHRWTKDDLPPEPTKRVRIP